MLAHSFFIEQLFIKHRLCTREIPGYHRAWILMVKDSYQVSKYIRSFQLVRRATNRMEQEDVMENVSG